MTRTRQHDSLSAAAALDLIREAFAQADRVGVACSVSVVGPQMELIAFAHADRATPHSSDSSRAKANTAASTRRPTGWMGADLAIPLSLATNLQLTNIIGGAPIVIAGTVVGAVGIAGGTPAQDEIIANAVAEFAVSF